MGLPFHFKGTRNLIFQDFQQGSGVLGAGKSVYSYKPNSYPLKQLDFRYRMFWIRIGEYEGSLLVALGCVRVTQTLRATRRGESAGLGPQKHGFRV